MPSVYTTKGRLCIPSAGGGKEVGGGPDVKVSKRAPAGGSSGIVRCPRESVATRRPVSESDGGVIRQSPFIKSPRREGETMKRHSLPCFLFVVFSIAAGNLSAGTSFPESTASVSPPSSASRPAQGPAARRSDPIEVRLGILLHDMGFDGKKKEEGEDLNIEVLFPTPRSRFLEAIWSPRPHVGASINDQGATSQVYGGLTWRLWHPGNLFLSVGFGFSVHDGKLRPGPVDREALGTRALFRSSGELGYWFLPRHGVSLLVDHSSNAQLSHDNDGLTNVGMRYLHRF